MTDAFIYDAVRTPRGKGMPARDDRPGGALAKVPPQALVAQLVAALDERSGSQAVQSVSRLLLGCVGQVGAQGGHLALVSRLSAGLADSVTVKTLNNYCVSGLTAIGDAVLWAQAGDRGLSLAGGVECLSQVPFLADQGAYYHDPRVAKALRWAPPVMGAELLATLAGYEQAELDAVSLNSHQRAARAWQSGRYSDSVIPVCDADGTLLLDRDELIRPDLTADQLAARPPAFAEQGAAGFDAMMLAQYPQLDAIGHVHTVAHCPGMADGAALALVGSREAGRRADLRPRARVVAWAEASGDPVLQFGAGFTAMEQALSKAGAALPDIDRIEFMEAFAAVPLKFLRDFEPDPERVNVNGGHLAMGHPMGATGAILVATLLHEMIRSDSATGLAVAHAGGGIGAALVLERL